jgi:uncharacterized membrane protein YbhN (UPF0104 family)
VTHTGRADGALTGTEPAGSDTPRSWRQKPAWRIASAVVGLLAFSLSLYYVATKLGQSIREIGEFDLTMRPGPVVVSWGLTFICVLSGGLLWHLILRGVGARVSLYQCTRIHLLANLGGYLPGYGWRFVGKAYLTQKQGIQLAVVSAAVLLEFFVLAVTRVVVALTVLPPNWLAQRGFELLQPYLVPLRVLSWAFLAVLPLAIERLAGWLRLRNVDRWGGIAVNKKPLWLALVSMSLSWLLFGLGLAALLHGLYRVRLSELPLIVYATTASSLVSLMLFVVPGGLAVREGVVIFVLEGAFPDLIVTAGALLGRAILLISELLGALVGSVMGMRERVMSITQKD